LARSAFAALSEATTLHAAIEAADPPTADLLQRLAVEDQQSDPDEVVIRLIERAAQRAVLELRAEQNRVEPDQQPGVAASIAWLKLTVESLRPENPKVRDAVMEAERALVGWLMSRDEAVRHPEANQ
jgi:hypothetical protein